MDGQESKLSKMDRQELLTHYEEMKEIAFRDALTGLLNRGALENAINQRLQNMRDEDSCALFIVDLDNFKEVNDTLGHQTGDKVLAKAARLLSGMFRATDVVGRLGGDEFVVFLSGSLSEKMIRGKGRMICDQLQFILGVDTEILVTASVGIHLSAGEKSFDYLYRSADLALYKAKKSGKQGYCIKRTTEEQEEQEENYAPVNAVRLRPLLEYIDSGVAMIEMSRSPSFIYVSPAFARMLDADSQTLIKNPSENILHPDDRQELGRLIREKVIKGKEPLNHIVRVLTKNGEILWWRFHIVQVDYNEEAPVILVTATDISDLKERESTLQKSNDLFRIAMKHTAQSIWQIDLAEKAFRLLGDNSSFPEYLTEPLAFPEDLIQLQWISPESADSFRGFAEEIFSGKMQGYGNFKLRYREPDLYSWGSFSYRTIFDEEGRAVRVVESLKE